LWQTGINRRIGKRQKIRAWLYLREQSLRAVCGMIQASRA